MYSPRTVEAEHARTPGADDYVDLGALGATLWRAKGWLVLFVLLGAMLGFGYVSYVAKPLFRASSTLVLEADRTLIAELTTSLTGLTDDVIAVNTQIEVLRSRSLLQAVVARLDLQSDPEFQGNNSRVSLLDRIMRLGPAPQASEDAATDMALSILSRRLSVRAVPNSAVIELSVVSGSPIKAARIADAIAAEFVRNQIEVKSQANQRASKWLSERVAALKLDLEAAEARVAGFSARAEVVSEADLREMDRQLKDLRERHARRDAGASTRATGLARAISELEQAYARQSDQLITLQQLVREADASRLLYEHFLGSLKETSLQQGIQQADSRVLSKAAVPHAPFSPRLSLVVILGAISGLVVGAAVVLRIEAKSGRIRTSQDLKAATGLSVMGQVPAIKARGRRDVVEILASAPQGAAAESIRNLRTSLLLARGSTPPKVVMTASSRPEEGKTTIAVALAQNLAKLGQNVLLIEGDLRRGTVADYLTGQPSGRLGDVLASSMNLDHAKIHDPLIGADVLIGGRTDSSAADVFSSRQFAELMDYARKHYDVVLIDSPPVLAVPDARILANFADAVLLTVRWNKTHRENVLESIRQFESAGRCVTGVVLNRVDPKAARKYDAAGSYGYYDRSYYTA